MNNLWRRLATVLAVALVVTAMTVDFFDLVMTHHDDEDSRETSQKQSEQADIEIICAAMFRRSAVNRLKCIEGDL